VDKQETRYFECQTHPREGFLYKKSGAFDFANCGISPGVKPSANMIKHRCCEYLKVSIKPQGAELTSASAKKNSGRNAPWMQMEEDLALALRLTCSSSLLVPVYVNASLTEQGVETPRHGFVPYINFKPM